MGKFYRVVQQEWASSARNGEGARRYGGRWNPPGIAAVYLAGSRALAALEVVVHAPRQALKLEWSLFEVDVPDEWVDNSKKFSLPEDWRSQPDSLGAQSFGGDWLKRRGAVALQLPSVIIPEEKIILMNPLHPDSELLKWSEARPFAFDPRLA